MSRLKSKPQRFLHTTAVHEAGHAVAACAYRIPFIHILLEPNPKSELCPISGMLNPWLGGYLKGKYGGIGRMRMYQARSNGSFVRRTATNSPTFRKRVQDHIVMLLAGREATELLFGGVPGSGHKKDYSDARKIIRRWLLPGADTGTCKSVIEKLRRRTKRLLRKRMASVMRVARELDLLGKLSAKEVRAIVKE